MTSIFEAFSSISSILILIALGYILTVNGKIKEESASFLTFLVVNVSLPCSIFKTITTMVDGNRIKELPVLVGLIAASQILSLVASFAMAKLFKIAESKKGTFITGSTFNNTLFMGLPVNLALFGESSAPIVLYYYLSSAVLFWTLGVKIISKGEGKRSFKIPSPIYGIIAGFLTLGIMKLNSNIFIPSFISSTVGYIANLTTPVSMIYIGYVIGKYGFKSIKLDKDVILAMVNRFVVAPLIFLLVIFIFTTDGLTRSVLTVQSFMPVMASQAIIARKYGADEEYTAIIIVLSTLLSLVIIPVVKVLVTMI